MLTQFSRTELLLGKDGMERLKNARVAVFGIGGVGGYTVEALARSGGKPLALSPAWPGLGAELEAQKKLPELGKSVAGMACAKLLDKLLPGAGK